MKEKATVENEEMKKLTDAIIREVNKTAQAGRQELLEFVYYFLVK